MVVSICLNADKLSAARTVLRKLRGNANIESELQSIVDSFNATKKQGKSMPLKHLTAP